MRALFFNCISFQFFAFVALFFVPILIIHAQNDPGTIAGQSACGYGWLFLIFVALVGITSLILFIRELNKDAKGRNKKRFLLGLSGLVLVLFSLSFVYIIDPDILGSCTEDALPGEETRGTFFGNASLENGWYIGIFNEVTGEYTYSARRGSAETCRGLERTLENSPQTEVLIPCFLVDATGITTAINDLPVITVIGRNPFSIRVGGLYRDPGARARNRYGDDISENIIVSGLPVPTEQEGNYVIVYRITDEEKNTVQISRTVSVVDVPFIPADPIRIILQENSIIVTDDAPVITIRGEEFVEVIIGDTYIDFGAEASDDLDGYITKNIITAGLPIDTTTIGSYTVVYRVTDSSGNTSTKERIVGVVERNIDTSNDLRYIRSCFGNNATGACAIADLNKDSTVSQADEDRLISRAAVYELNGDVRVELLLGDPIHSCFLKLNSICALESHGSTIVTMEYLLSSLPILDGSTAPGYDYAINLSSLSQKLSSSIRDRIVYETLAQYDLTQNGILDLSEEDGGSLSEDFEFLRDCFGKLIEGGCANADINQDGTINAWDLKFFEIIQSTLLPKSFTVEEFDWALFDPRLYSDARIMEHCAEKTLALGNCELTDINNDGVTNGTDRDLFNKNTPQFDLNKDRVINGPINALFF